MFKTKLSIKSEAICWHQFSRRSDAVFLSLGREIRIGVLSVATLLTATPDSAAAKVAMTHGHTETTVEECAEGLSDETPPNGVSWLTEEDTLFATANQKDDSQHRIIKLPNTEITASRVPIPKDKATRLVQVITAEEIEASPVQCVNDLLKLVASVDVRQRGGYGIQTDIGVNGGNQDQLTVMLNGVNISNPHTGHLTMDLPVSVDDIARIEVLEGGASRVYGSSAFAGVINIVTKSATSNQVGVNLTGGSYGTFGTNGHINLRSGNFTNRISGGWTQSDGATPNSDFKKGNLYWNEKYYGEHFDVKFQAGMSSTKYGANTFYGTGSSAQYEENTRYMTSLQGETKGKVHVTPQLYWNRTYDHYIWTRTNPEAYQNYHLTTVYGANINAWTQWSLGKTAIGLEFRRENILSTRLGKPIDVGSINQYPGYKYKDGRSNIGLYLEHTVLLDNWSFSAGLLSNKNTSVEGGMRLYPGIDLSYRPMKGMQFYASFNQSLRTPTYTELYYNGPGLEANNALEPEKSSDFSLGWSYTHSLFSSKISAFYRKETNMIEWVKRQGATVWNSANSDIDNLGLEAQLALDFRHGKHHNPILQRLSLAYCYNFKERTNAQQSANYANQLVFLRHKFVASLNHRIFSHLSAQWDFIYKDRTGWFDSALTGAAENYGKFGQVDLKLQWQAKDYTLFLQGNNLTDRHYYDIPNVRQPGFWFTAGAKLTFSL